jgi:hypothetical protein
MAYRHNYYIDKIEYRNIIYYRLIKTSKLLENRIEITNTWKIVWLSTLMKRLQELNI